MYIYLSTKIDYFKYFYSDFLDTCTRLTGGDNIFAKLFFVVMLRSKHFLCTLYSTKYSMNL